MLKNTIGQKWIVFAFDRTTNIPQTGDAANITANIRIDGGAANPIDDLNPSELEDGYYIFDITQVETNGDLLLINPESSTPNIQVIGIPGSVWTSTSGSVSTGAVGVTSEISSQAVSGNTIAVTTTFTDDNGDGITPVSLSYSIYDEWNNLVCGPATPTSIGSVTIVALPASAITLASDVDYKTYRKIKWSGTYNSATLGNGLPLKETGWFVINKS